MVNARREVRRGFVVLEGIDGTGTTTQLRLTAERLGAAGVPHWTSFEPSDLPTGEFCRRILAGDVRARPGTIARLFAADRHEHLYGLGGAIERLDRGEIVVFDRYLFSSVAYQGLDCGRELPERLNADFPLPELLIYFDIDVDTAMSRVARRSGRDIYEIHAIQERVRAAYEAILADYASTGMRIERVDAAAPLGEVTDLVARLVDSVIPRAHAG